jgi:hypothetical protein
MVSWISNEGLHCEYYFRGISGSSLSRRFNVAGSIGGIDVSLPYMFCPRQVDGRIGPRIGPLLVVQIQDPFPKRGCESEGLGDHISANRSRVKHHRGD